MCIQEALEERDPALGARAFDRLLERLLPAVCLPDGFRSWDAPPAGLELDKEEFQNIRCALQEAAGPVAHGLGGRVRVWGLGFRVQALSRMVHDGVS